MRHHEFCATDPFFYDRSEPGAGPGFATVAPRPEGWSAEQGENWRMLHPPGVVLPAQGWKIHVAATAESAERVLTAVHRYCRARRIAFKHLRSPEVLLRTNTKYADRGSSGKFVTIYPVDEPQLRTTLDELSAELAGEVGPYVLTDLRYGDGPLYVRYGGFVRRWVETGDGRLPAVAAPDGTLVPDRREPRFQVPEWVSLPEFLRPHAQPPGDGFGYTVTGALHYSNGGGVYRATRQVDGREVVLKEARPHAGLDGDGRDAVHRLGHEFDILRRLAGVPGVVAAHDLLSVWEHRFLVMDAVPGVSLRQWLTQHYPQSQADPRARDVDAYAARALAIADRVADVVAAIHRRGVVIGDLHPSNVMVDADDQVTLIDFEVAVAAGRDLSELQELRRIRLGTPGFRAPADRRGPAVDRHALAVLRLWLFLPLAPVLELARANVHTWVTYATARFGLPAGFAESVLAELAPQPARVPSGSPSGGGTEPGWPAEWPHLRSRIVDGILAAATPDRLDRLFPGDPYQFETGPAGLAHGAAGVLHALRAIGVDPAPEHQRWLLDAVQRTPPAWPGLYHGSHGVAAVLAEFGHHDEADRLVDQAAPEVDRTLDPGLENGLAGIGIGLLALPAARHREAAVAVGRRLAALLVGEGAVPEAGLRRGWSGAALLFARLFAHTGDAEWLELADRAVQRELDGCVPAGSDGLTVRDRWGRALSYLDTGVAGIAVAAAALAEHAPDAAGAAALPALLRGCRSEFVIEPGLAQGRAGLVLALAAARHRTLDTTVRRDAERAIEQHVTNLAWHAVEHAGAIAFPGHQLLRLSTDLATGSAGILLALHAALAEPGGTGPVLPFPEGTQLLTAPTP